MFIVPVRVTLFAVSLLLAAASLTGCNTVQGFGQDLNAAGEAIDDQATKHKRY